MSEITSGTAVVSAQVAGAALIAPLAAAGGCAAIGYALTGLPMWGEIERTAPLAHVVPTGYCRINDLSDTLCGQLESFQQYLLQTPTSLPLATVESVAGWAALRQIPALAGIAAEKFPRDVADLAAKMQALPALTVPQLAEFNACTASVLEGTLLESRQRLAAFVVKQTKTACRETGWTLRDEATSEHGVALIARNQQGQRLALHIGRDGALSTDVSGFNGRDCERAMAAFYQALERHGVRVEQRQEQPHYLFQGGALLNGVSQAQQVLRNAAKQHKRATKAKPSKQPPQTNQTADRNRKAQLLAQRLRQTLG